MSTTRYVRHNWNDPDGDGHDCVDCPADSPWRCAEAAHPAAPSVTAPASGTTSDRNDPRLTRGVDDAPVAMAEAYLVLSDDDRAKGFVRPVRRSYVHQTCGTATTMGQAIAETYARDPSFYGATFCVHCRMHRPVGEHGEFVWDDGSKVGT